MLSFARDTVVEPFERPTDGSADWASRRKLVRLLRQAHGGQAPSKYVKTALTIPQSREARIHCHCIGSLPQANASALQKTAIGTVKLYLSDEIGHPRLNLCNTALYEVTLGAGDIERGA